ncbi:MAG: uroporphyrinogen decarboxylase [Rickettsiaceae bacterium]|nr:uroporphyrinogen decarboxylase [Rickettsiaceae bacterium]
MKKKEKLFNKKEGNVPIWLMRQAGRYQKEYREIRKTEKSFLDLCYNSEKVHDITMLPIKSFGFDAAIIFSDILVLPHILGWDVNFKEGEGPILRRFESAKDFQYFTDEFDHKVENIYTAINKLSNNLPEDVSLIGFAGSPWTVTSYLLEGRGKQNFSVSKSFIYNNYKTVLKLINFITDKTIRHLENQIKAGVNVIQLFDSWSGMLSGNEYNDFVIKPTQKIVKQIKENHPTIPVIGFPRGSGFLYDEYITKTGIDAVSVDQFVPVAKMKEWQKDLVVQGNLDPVVLLSNKETIAMKAEEILSNIDRKNFIFNLGHGILPSTPVENVKFLVDYVKNYQK